MTHADEPGGPSGPVWQKTAPDGLDPAKTGGWIVLGPIHKSDASPTVRWDAGRAAWVSPGGCEYDDLDLIDGYPLWLALPAPPAWFVTEVEAEAAARDRRWAERQAYSDAHRRIAPAPPMRAG
jgi:hypothetical protein